MRIASWLALGVACFALAACRRHTPPEPESTAEEVQAPAPPPASSPPSRSMKHDDIKRRLFAAFEQCGRHPLPKFDGHWVNSTPLGRDVWFCEGRIRWRTQFGGTMDICISKVTPVTGGMDVEGVWHEDLHDPGDASGVHLQIRDREGGLSVEMASFEEPSNRSPFLLLERKPDPADRPGMSCPLQ